MTQPALKAQAGYLLLCEVALGQMHHMHKPGQLSHAPTYCHSVYGLGQLKPKLIGIKDVNRGLKNLDGDDGNFLPSEMTVCSPEALFFHTGKLDRNLDIQTPDQVDQKFNDYVVYDEAQVRLRYLV
jgi:hypothetical protein